jgi:polar amino acid transport system permease protein
MFWDWSFAHEILRPLAVASLVTLEATIIGFAIAAVLGLVLAIGRLYGPTWLRMPLSGAIEFIRSTPLLIQIFFIYFVFPEFGLTLPAFTAGIIALGLHYATYCSEVYRSGLANIARGQWEACTALNLSSFYVFRDVIIPQAIPPVVPALGNYFVALFKDTPLLSAIAVVELMQTAKIIGSENFRYTEPITIVGVIFLIFSLVAAGLVRLLEAWLSKRIRRS